MFDKFQKSKNKLQIINKPKNYKEIKVEKNILF